MSHAWKMNMGRSAMKFGVCTNIEMAQTAYEAGYEFIECTVHSLEPEREDREVADKLQLFLDSPVPVEAFNIFIPKELKITGENVDEQRLNRYVKKALQRVKTVGGETVVFGSGDARTLPEGFPRERGTEQIARFLHRVADVADEVGVTIVIEPLYRKAANIINDIPEAVAMAERVNRKPIRVLADFFHMMEENDPLEHIVDYRSYIQHIHISDHYRPPGSGQYPFRNFVECIRKSGYNGRISVECIWNDFPKEAAAALNFVKTAFTME